MPLAAPEHDLTCAYWDHRRLRVHWHQPDATLPGPGIQPVNLDWNPPLDPAHAPYWQNCDILEAGSVRAIFQETAPTHVVHLAARPIRTSTDMGGYLQNHEGTRSLLEVVRETPSVERLIVTSTQFVCEAGYQPKDDPGPQALHPVGSPSG